MEKEKPFFSIIIPCYNYGHLLSRALDSILDQDYSKYEIIIINDGSTDNSHEVCQEYSNNNEQINCLSQINSGPATARNYGIDQSQGSYIVFLDADDALENGILAAIASILNDDNNIECLIGGHTSVFIDGKIKYICAPKLPRSPEKCFIGYLEKEIRLCNGGMVIGRSVFNTLKFPEELRSCEDIPFFALILLLFKCQSTDISFAKIYKHPDSLRHDSQRAEQFRLLAIEKIFQHEIPQSLQQYKRKYTAKAYLSLFRTQYKTKKFEEAKKNYYNAIKIDGSNILNFSALLKIIKILFFQMKSKIIN